VVERSVAYCRLDLTTTNAGARADDAIGDFSTIHAGLCFYRWPGTVAPKGHLSLALGQVIGLLFTLLGFSLGGRWPLFGLFTLLLIWWWATWLWFCCIHRAPQTDQRHARCILGAMVAGNVAILASIAWVLSAEFSFWLVARDLTLWAWIVPIFLTVAHRMIPFFTQAVVPQREIWRPISILYAWLGSCALLVVASALALPELGAMTAAGLAVSTAYTAWTWAGGQLRGACAGNRLLAMLHLSFAWLPLAFVLYMLGQMGIAVGAAAEHAVGMGFCVTMLIGFVTRVSLGHSGRPLQASNVYWSLYLGLHGVALLRVVLALCSNSLPNSLVHITATLWVVLIAIWAMHMLPLYWRARADGQAG
jgi:uncharacterized protein involved in response to NO